MSKAVPKALPKIFTVIDRFQVVYEWLYKIVMTICKLLLVVDILITFMAVLGRYISFIPDPAWSEQVVLTLMVYMAVLSAALAIRRRGHIAMTIFDKRLPRKMLLWLELFADLAVLTLGIIMLVYGWKLCRSPLATFGRYESMPWLSRFWMYFPIPLAGFSMIVFQLEQFYLHIKDFFLPVPEVQEVAAP